MSKTKEVQELVVLTDKQIKALPQVVKDNVIFLTEEMGAKDLMVLNPMVTELIEIRELGSKMNMIPADKDGNYNKANIQTFIDLKKKIRTFRSGVKSSAKIMKEPYQKINKGIIAIEKTFIEEATNVYDNAETEYADYIKAEEEKALVKQKAKDQILLDKIAEQKAIADEAQLKLNKSNFYNKIKYELINGLITDATAQAVVNGNEKFVIDLKSKIEGYSYELITTGVDDSILEESVVGELKHYYINAKQKAIVMLSSRLEVFEQERKNLILESKAKEETQVPPVPIVSEKEGFVSSKKISNYNDEEFINKIIIAGKEMLNGVEDKIENQKYSPPLMHQLKLILIPFKTL